MQAKLVEEYAPESDMQKELVRDAAELLAIAGLEGARMSRTLSSCLGRINHPELTACDGAVVSLSSSILSPWPMQHYSPLPQ